MQMPEESKSKLYWKCHQINSANFLFLLRLQYLFSQTYPVARNLEFLIIFCHGSKSHGGIPHCDRQKDDMFLFSCFSVLRC